MIEYAFKCRNCGTLEPPSAAGELERPAKCHICGKGARFDPETGIRELVPDNWIVLAELTGKDLKDLHEYHRFDPEVHAIVAHKPAAADNPDRTPVSIEVSAEDGVAGAGVVEVEA